MAARGRMAAFYKNKPPFKGGVEGDESYFGGPRKRGLRGRGAYGKLFVFGLLKWNGKFYARDKLTMTLKAIIQGIIRRKINIKSIYRGSIIPRANLLLTTLILIALNGASPKPALKSLRSLQQPFIGI